MLHRNFALAVSAVLLATLGACSTAGTKPLASDSTPARDLSSWCQGDRPVSYAPAPVAGVDDPGNRFDTEETVRELQQHNARLRAACPDSQPN